MSIVGAIIVPHPPIIVPTVGRGREAEVQATIDAYHAAAKQVAAWAPEVLIVTSPHTVMYADYFHISPGEDASGNMSAFGAPQAVLNVRYDAELRQELVRQAEAAGIQAGTLGEKDPALDHGTFLPLYFLRDAGVDCPILRIGLSGFSPLEHYRLGQCIARAVDALDRRTVFVASGDLSHKLKDDGPYGYAPEGPVFDRRVTQAMESGDFLQFLTMDASLCDRAAECGLRSFQIMAGALDGLAVSPALLNYEGTFGVGYGVATFAVTGPDENRRFARQCEEMERARLAERKAAEDPWVRLARLSLETYVRTGKQLDTLPDVLGEPEAISSPAELDIKRYGVIVSCGGRRGLLLPDLEGVDTIEQQIDIARQKGGISSREQYTLERFEVVRHT